MFSLVFVRSHFVLIYGTILRITTLDCGPAKVADVLWPYYLWSCSKASADQSRGSAGEILGNRMHQPPTGTKRFGTSWHTVRLVKSMNF